MNGLTPEQLNAEFAFTLTLQWTTAGGGQRTVTQMGTVNWEPGENRYLLTKRLVQEVQNAVGAPGSTVMFLSLERNQL